MRSLTTHLAVDSKLAAGDVHLWEIQLAIQETEIRTCRKLLSADELQRADRFYFESHRTRFTVARGAMRKVLAGYVNVAPRELEFSYNEKGKPDLPSSLPGPGIKFNLSHSRDYALLAVAQGLSVGVDIEFIDHQFATSEIATRFFSTREVSTLRALPPSARVEAFFSCWTRKEAYVKALGEGLSVPLDSFDVAFGPDVPAALLRVEASPQELSRWKMYDITAPKGYAAALVVEGKEHRFRQWQWRPEL